VSALKALGEDDRVRIIALLMEAPFGVCEIARRMGLTEYNVSKYLRILREAGLLDVEKQGRERLYAVPVSIRRSRARANTGSWLLQLPVRSITVTSPCRY